MGVAPQQYGEQGQQRREEGTAPSPLLLPLPKTPCPPRAGREPSAGADATGVGGGGAAAGSAYTGGTAGGGATDDVAACTTATIAGDGSPMVANASGCAETLARIGAEGATETGGAAGTTTAGGTATTAGSSGRTGAGGAAAAGRDFAGGDFGRAWSAAASGWDSAGEGFEGAGASTISGAVLGTGGTGGFIATGADAGSAGDLPLAADATAACFGGGVNSGALAITIAEREEQGTWETGSER
ncbi:unnamed protein product [Closterium sp. Naga37s-1]|nr:unnamed protein product [Closterium sp. Naga37s-1]